MTDDINDVRHTSTLAKFEEAVRRSSPVSETARQEALDDLKSHREVWRGAIASHCTPFGSDDDGSYWDHELRAFDRTFAVLTAGHAQRPAEHGMQGAVQYRRKDGGYGLRWITMAMFDGALAAESYCSRQRKDDKWPFEYRAIELSAAPDTSTDQKCAYCAGTGIVGRRGLPDWKLTDEPCHECEANGLCARHAVSSPDRDSK